MSILELLIPRCALISEVGELTLLFGILIGDRLLQVLYLVFSLLLLLLRLFLVLLKMLFLLVSNFLQLLSPRLEHSQLVLDRSLFLERGGQLSPPECPQALKCFDKASKLV